jgi:hypothetical protein
MSRRKKALPAPRRTKDIANRRLRVFCTGSLQHGPYLVLDVYMRNSGRSDIDGMLTGTGRSGSAVADDLDAARRGKIPLRLCERCAESQPLELDRSAIEQLIDEMSPRAVLRWDISTGRVLMS